MPHAACAPREHFLAPAAQANAPRVVEGSTRCAGLGLGGFGRGWYKRAMDSSALERELKALRRENELLRERLEGIEARSEQAAKARKRLLGGGLRVLIPLLDRQKVARSFGTLAETVSGYSGAPSQWPSREEVILHTREFLESVVRFVIRRRMIIFVFSLIATLIPAIQIWLVFQQNKIIENQNEFAEVQVFDIVSRSMTEGDRNARIMTGALLANAEIGFLRNVMDEAFDKNAFSLYRREGLDAFARRAKDTAFRGNLIRAAVRIAEKRVAGGEDPKALLREVRPMYRRILEDSEYRLPEVIRTGRGDTGLTGELLEDVDMYIAQVGELLKVYGRLARTTGETAAYYDDIRGLLTRMSKMSSVDESTFSSTYRVVMQDFLFEEADSITLESGPFRLGNREPEAVLRAGLDALKRALGADALNWKGFLEQVSSQRGRED